MGRVLITRRLPDGGLDPLTGHDLIGPKSDDDPFTTEELLELAPDVDAIVSLLTDAIDASLLATGAAGRLRIVANVAVGYNNIDIAAAHALGVIVTNTPGVLDETTADTAFLLILAASRLAYEAEADLRAGRWHGWGINQYLGQDVHDATLGIVGYGRIGDKPWEIMSIGRFHTKLVRRNGGWLFSEVENRSIGKAGGPATILHHPTV